jgi:hypothetical protein
MRKDLLFIPYGVQIGKNSLPKRRNPAKSRGFQSFSAASPNG